MSTLSPNDFNKLLVQLRSGGCLIVSSHCSNMEIAFARIDNRFIVDDDSFGYVLRLPYHRKRLARDNDGHDYLIPEDKIEQFDKWVESTESDFEGEYTGEDFNSCRLNMSPRNYVFVGSVEEVR